MLDSREEIYKGKVRGGFVVVDFLGTPVEFVRSACEPIKVISAWPEGGSKIPTRRDYQGVVQEALGLGANVLITSDVSKFDLMPSTYLAYRISPLTLEIAKGFCSEQYLAKRGFREVRPVPESMEAGEVVRAGASPVRES